MAISFNGTTFTGTNASHQVNFNGTSMCTVADANCNIRFDHQSSCVLGSGWNCICPNWTLYCREFWFIQGGTSLSDRVSPRASMQIYFRSWNPVSCCSRLNGCVWYQHNYPYVGMRCHLLYVCNHQICFSGQVNFNNCCGYTNFTLGSGGTTSSYSGIGICTGTTCWSYGGCLPANCNQIQVVCFTPNPSATISRSRLRIRVSPTTVVFAGCPFTSANAWNTNITYNMFIPADIIGWNWLMGCTMNQVISCVSSHTCNFMCSFTGNQTSIGTIGLLDWSTPSYFVCRQMVSSIDCPMYAAMYNFRNNISVSMNTGDLWYRSEFGCTCAKGNSYTRIERSCTCASI